MVRSDAPEAPAKRSLEPSRSSAKDIEEGKEEAKQSAFVDLEVPLIFWTRLRHNQPKEVSDECTATEVHIRI